MSTAAVLKLSKRVLSQRITTAHRSIPSAPHIRHHRRPYTTAKNTKPISGSRIAQVASTTGNLLLVGSVMTLFGYLMYTLYDNLLSESGTTHIYNNSLDLIRAHPEIKKLFGHSVAGFGEPTHSQRQRQRAIAHNIFEDSQGRQRLTMQYYIKNGSDKNAAGLIGVVKVDLAQSRFTKAWDYNYIVVDLVDKADGGVRGRVEVLVTDEFKREVEVSESERKKRRFSSENKGSSDGSWFSALNPAHWRK
ncbi:mitochondrial import inner membrane translocase subunit tim21 [Kickxella alabastrina]|uniref:Mitochondrial import inner membrane translocase subunit tim21 n=1 Tax=Kickxella alabastrina TaxID=61397 RepID=A0ACC1I9B3_9FUNG|nr:mitochondrial import inner membrane translocase subunit tim21 [Kickxella alabastrina]